MIRLRGPPTRPCTIHPSSDLRVRNRRAQLPECSPTSTNSVMLRRFAWSSLPSASFSAARLHEAAALWRFNNERHHVSGMLLFTGIHFLAIVEGDECDVGRLWLRLQEDDRHRDLVRIGDVACGTRWFPRWMISFTNNAVASPQIEALRALQAPIPSRWARLIHPIMLRALAST